MKNILYKDLSDEIIDGLDTFTSQQNTLGEYLRQKKQSSGVIARAATAAMIGFLRQISHISVPDLVHTVDLTLEGNYNGVYAYPFPSDALHERNDAGVISFVLKGEQLSPQNNTPYEQLAVKARMVMYSSDDNLFNIDINKRRFYTLRQNKAQAVIFKRPHSIFAPSQNQFHGVSIALSGVSGEGPITLSDGIGNDLPVTFAGADSAAVRVEKIVDAVNANEDFAYNAVISPQSADSVQLYIREEVSTNARLRPVVAPAGTGTYTILDTGTYMIPVPYHFIDVLASSGLANLMSEARTEARDAITDQQQSERQPRREQQ